MSRAAASALRSQLGTVLILWLMKTLLGHPGDGKSPQGVDTGDVAVHQRTVGDRDEIKMALCADWAPVPSHNPHFVW